jgi:nicotinate-nucleotide adenylyltransferase
MKRVGVYAGTFDPLHIGHVSFGRAALTEARLDIVYYVPERSPRHKQLATPYDARVSTIVRTLHEYNGLELLELPERALTVDETLPELTSMFPDTQLVLLFGADVVVHMSTWTHIDALVQTCEFAIGMRDGYARNDVVRTLQRLRIDPSRSTIIQTAASHVSSSAIRSEMH